MNFSFTSIDQLAALPSVMATLFGSALLLWRLFGLQPSRWCAGLAILGSAFSAAALARQHLWLAAESSREIVAFHGALTIDPFALFFAWLMTGSAALVMLASRQKRPEYYALILFAQCGMFFMTAGTDLVTLFLGLELMSLCFYILVGYGPGEQRSAEAAIKYLLLGGFSSALLAYGFSLFFGVSGSTLLRDISGAVAARGSSDPLILLALGTTVAGLLFKLAAAPFHMWAPDTYEGAPISVTAYLAVASKVAALALVVRLLPLTLDTLHYRWQPVLAVAAVLTLTIGNLAAMTQNNLKRLLAYSSIAHVGYLLLGLVAGNATGLRGVGVYAAVYASMTLGAFLVVLAVERGHGQGEDISALSGMMRKSPWLALSMLLFVLSLIGIPPTAGFWGKYYIVLALLETGHYALALIAVIYVAVSCYYYFRIVRYLFLAPSLDDRVPGTSWGLKMALGVSALATLAASFLPDRLLSVASEAMR